MGIFKGVGAAATALALVLSGADVSGGKVCAQSLDISEPKKSDDRLDIKAQLGLGVRMNSVRGIQSESFINDTNIVFQYGQWFGAELSSVSYFEFTDESIDKERRKLRKRPWSETEAAAEFLPIQLTLQDDQTANARAGMVGRIRFRENTPTGETFSLYASVAPEIKVEKEQFTVRFGIGGYYYNVIIDEDVLHRRRRPKESLRVESWGLVCRADGEYRFDNKIRVGGLGELMINQDGDLREARARGYVDFPVDLGWLFADSTVLKSCAIYMRVYGQIRHADLGDKDDDVTFHDDAAVGFELILELNRFSKDSK